MKRFFKGFVFAFRGIIACIKEERNFRFHLTAAFHLFLYLPFFDVSRTDVCVLVMLCALVIGTEAVNSAIERAVDCTGTVSPKAGTAKDMAAGAVLTMAVASVICGVIILWQPDAFRAIWRFYREYPIAAALQAGVFIGWMWWVFYPRKI